MEKLRATEHHYIRCLKPNQTLKAGDWDNDFMFKQLAYSGTLEVTQIRKAGLNVRRPLKHFYQYYKICADDPTALRAGTVTKRTELLLKQLGIDENKYRVGKTLLFLQNYDIIDALDKLREELKIVLERRHQPAVLLPHAPAPGLPPPQSFMRAQGLPRASSTAPCCRASASRGRSAARTWRCARRRGSSRSTRAPTSRTRSCRT